MERDFAVNRSLARDRAAMILDGTGMGDFDFGILEHVGHRPWPVPERPWLMTQTWHDLLFAHWPLEACRLRSLVPIEFELDLFDGAAWLGIVPFQMTNVTPRGIPPLPWLSAFPELNVRTYVRVGDKPGVFFFSLDAGSATAVIAARALVNLPYHHASMRVARNGAIRFESRREHAAQTADFSVTYVPRVDVSTAAPGSLAYFLTERYCLFHRDRRGRPYRLDIHHPPWRLQPADARIITNGMAAVNGITLPADVPLLHFSKRQDMVAWGPEPVRG